MAEHIHWKKTTNPDYLGAYAFDDGKDMIVQVKDVRIETVQNQQGKEDKPVLFFEGDVKPLILNTTNMKAIEKVCGSPYMDEWVGKKISVGTSKVKAFGQVHDAIRVRSEKPDDELIICEECGSVITAAAGKQPSELAEISKRNTGRVLCLACMKKAKEAAE